MSALALAIVEMQKKFPTLRVLEVVNQPVVKTLWNRFTKKQLQEKPRVRVYLNIIKTKKTDEYAVFSIQHKNKVMVHAYFIELENFTFFVNEKVRDKVLKTKRTVHAWVEGDLVSYSQVPSTLKGRFKHIVSYNPFKGPNFYDVKTDEVIQEAKSVLFFRRAAHITK